MLPRFRVSLDEAINVPGDDLKSTVASIFEKVGVPPEDAELGADVLVLADLRGVDSHGVSNMLRSYLGGYQRGEINPQPNISIVRETAATAAVDSDRGLGTIVTPKAMEIAIRKASEVGVGMVTIGNSRHLGMASYHAMLALEHDMIGVCMTSAPPRMVPTFGAEPLVEANPFKLRRQRTRRLPECRNHRNGGQHRRAGHDPRKQRRKKPAGSLPCPGSIWFAARCHLSPYVTIYSGA